MIVFLINTKLYTHVLKIYFSLMKAEEPMNTADMIGSVSTGKIFYLNLDLNFLFLKTMH